MLFRVIGHESEEKLRATWMYNNLYCNVRRMWVELFSKVILYTSMGHAHSILFYMQFL